MRRPATTGVAAYAALVVACTLAVATGLVPRWSGAVHLVALPPLDVAADARWLLARATSWPLAVGGAAALLAVRITALALLLDAERPRWRLAAIFYAVVWLPAVLAAQLDFIAHAALYSRLFGGALFVLAALFVLSAATPWVPLGRGTTPGGQDTGRVATTGDPVAWRLGVAWRAAVRAGLRAPVLAAYVAALLVLGALAEATRPVGIVVAVPVSGALTLATVARLRAPVPQRPLAGLAGVTALGLALWGTTVVTRDAPWTASTSERDGSAVIMSGINSASGEGAIFTLQPAFVGYTCEQFTYYSYAGPGDSQPQGVAVCPLDHGAPYVPDHTQRPFDEQVALLEAQAADLEPPIVVFAHSQAAWVAWQAAAEERLDGLAALVLLGPFPSSPLTWPPPGENGPGLVGGELFRQLVPLADLVDFDFLVDAPLSRELLATPDAASAVFAQPLPDGVEALAVTASSDLAVMPDGWRIDGALDVCPLREAHPYLPITPHFHRAADRFLDGEVLRDPPAEGEGQRGCPPWADLYHLASQPFGAPPVDR
ncbi:hypothetical protein GCM10011354_01710 [Egicoccus halophilus]|uniref:Alpha/beta hydrolase family protein n=1 Tax=Egicoccus halophilus TaxID=1670830 RepID=A0A8J3A4X4_9ACTN|nr:hypothetical protein GCM10011354_01710 [Egicoccus halophilus]